MEFSAWLSIASVCALGAISPGPSLAVVIRNTVVGGRLQGIVTGVGHSLGIGLYALVAVFGMTILLENFPDLIQAVRMFGGAYLLWMGIQTLRHAGQENSEPKQAPRVQGFVDGLAISGLNPKTAVFFLALIGPFIPVQASQIERIGVAGMALLIDGAWYSLVACTLVQTGAVDWLSQQGKIVDRLLATLLIGIGSWLLVA